VHAIKARMGNVNTAFEQDHPGPARKLSTNLYDI